MQTKTYLELSSSEYFLHGRWNQLSFVFDTFTIKISFFTSVLHLRLYTVTNALTLNKASTYGRIRQICKPNFSHLSKIFVLVNDAIILEPKG